jgi:hypothetical protein
MSSSLLSEPDNERFAERIVGRDDVFDAQHRHCAHRRTSCADKHLNPNLRSESLSSAFKARRPSTFGGASRQIRKACRDGVLRATGARCGVAALAACELVAVGFKKDVPQPPPALASKSGSPVAMPARGFCVLIMPLQAAKPLLRLRRAYFRKQTCRFNAQWRVRHARLRGVNLFVGPIAAASRREPTPAWKQAAPN